MSRKSLGIILMVIGLILLGVSLSADALGIGAQPGIVGWKQLLGATVGLVMAIGGVVMYLRRRPKPAK